MAQQHPQAVLVLEQKRHVAAASPARPDAFGDGVQYATGFR
jgi:hypothetical protein